MPEEFRFQELKEELNALKNLLVRFNQDYARLITLTEPSKNKWSVQDQVRITIAPLDLKNLTDLKNGLIRVTGEWIFECSRLNKNHGDSIFIAKKISAQVMFVSSASNGQTSRNEGVGWHFDFEKLGKKKECHPRCHLQFTVTANRQAGGVTSEANRILPRIPHHLLTPILFFHWILHIYKGNEFINLYKADNRWIGIARDREGECLRWIKEIVDNNGNSSRPWVPFVEAVETPW
ncbi:MAG: hypothetical protein HY559_00235 [Gammaproteobacteria bacterium]|nr:hypothetical protein [Gammaproteobacteria bacterium]